MIMSTFINYDVILRFQHTLKLRHGGFFHFKHISKRHGHTLEGWEWCRNVWKGRYFIPSSKTVSACVGRKLIGKIEFYSIFKRYAYYMHLPCCFKYVFFNLISKSFILHHITNKCSKAPFVLTSFIIFALQRRALSLTTVALVCFTWSNVFLLIRYTSLLIFRSFYLLLFCKHVLIYCNKTRKAHLSFGL